MTQEYGDHGRCTATAKSTGERCRRPAKANGKCRFHGGDTPSGRDSPHFEHGLYSDHLSEADREVAEILEDVSDAAKLEAIINWRLARLRRAAENLHEGGDGRTFWDAFEELVSTAADPDAEDIEALGEILSQGNRALHDELNVVRRLIVAHHRVTDGKETTLSFRALLGGGES